MEVLPAFSLRFQANLYKKGNHFASFRKSKHRLFSKSHCLESWNKPIPCSLAHSSMKVKSTNLLLYVVHPYHWTILDLKYKTDRGGF